MLIGSGMEEIMKVFNKNKKLEEKKKEEYLKEYLNICKTITNDLLFNKEIIIEYDENLPDMYALIPIKNNEYVDIVKYDLYVKRLHKVLLRFPNGKVDTCNVKCGKEIEIDNYFYKSTYIEPLVELNYYGNIIPISLFDLIINGVKIYVVDYNLQEIDIENK